MKRHTEEQKRHMREAALRFWEGLSPEERARRKALGRACGLKSWEQRSDEQKAAEVARLNTPEVRAKNAEAVRVAKAKLFADDPDWLKKRMQEKWSRQDPVTLAQRAARSATSRRNAANLTPEQKAAFRAAARKARMKAVEGVPVEGAGPVLHFESVTEAARDLVERRVSPSLTGARHLIYEVCNGRRKTAYDYCWHYVSQR